MLQKDKKKILLRLHPAIFEDLKHMVYEDDSRGVIGYIELILAEFFKRYKFQTEMPPDYKLRTGRIKDELIYRRSPTIRKKQ